MQVMVHSSRAELPYPPAIIQVEKNNFNYFLTIVFSLYTLLRMKNEKQIIHRKFQSILSLAQKMEKTRKSFGTGEMISHSEIHLIEIVGDTQDLSVTDLSRHMGITKGAVSQSLKRLENKGFTTKKTDPENLSRSIVLLSSKGQTAYWAHKHWHETMDGGFLKYLDELDDEAFEIIIDFLVRVESFFKLRLESDA